MITIFLNNRSPSLTDTIRVDGAAFPLTTSTVKLRMRAAASSTLKVDTAATVVSAPAGTVRYDWAALDVDTAGEYVAWWRVTLPSGFVQETPTFAVTVTDPASLTQPPDLCTVADVKQAMETSSGAADPLIQMMISAASVMIPNKYQRDFAPRTAQTYTFKVFGFSVDLSPHDLRSATTVTLDPNGTPVVLAATQYRLAPSGAESNLGTFTNVQLSRVQNLYSTGVTYFGYSELGILGNWGPTAIPADVTRACALTVASWLSARTQSQTSDLLGDLSHSSREVRPERFGGFAIPFDAHMILSQYDRPASHFA